ncbi:S8 family serine peptidase [Kribbella sp. NBC_01245]|uniref:S8 family serine peptidase n=1 Tax=Kribbella sp. NBC_01245 TaxID=2903578 RepID=UPI002E2DB168|nr:S8 family serine peptidase [Kribbella sp. NBC_01245]
MTMPWRGTGVEQFPGVPAWGAPTSRRPPEPFPVVPLGGIDPQWAWGGADGSGVRVCILDSGVDASHPLVGGVEGAFSIVLDDTGALAVAAVEPADSAGHGTACAGIIRSIAPAAAITSMRVLTDAATGTGHALLTGLDWAINEGFDVINLSLATTKADYILALYELADRAYFRRCTLVVSAHNLPVRSFPWPFAAVLSVASHDQEDPMLHYYNPAPPVEFLARGVAVPVAWANGKVVRSTGNSFASPHIAGLCALILGKHPWLTPAQLKSVLYLTARNVTDSSGEDHVPA